MKSVRPSRSKCHSTASGCSRASLRLTAVPRWYVEACSLHHCRLAPFPRPTPFHNPPLTPTQEEFYTVGPLLWRREIISRYTTKGLDESDAGPFL